MESKYIYVQVRKEVDVLRKSWCCQLSEVIPQVRGNTIRVKKCRAVPGPERCVPWLTTAATLSGWVPCVASHPWRCPWHRTPPSTRGFPPPGTSFLCKSRRGKGHATVADVVATIQVLDSRKKCFKRHGIFIDYNYFAVFYWVILRFI